MLESWELRLGLMSFDGTIDIIAIDYALCDNNIKVIQINNNRLLI